MENQLIWEDRFNIGVEVIDKEHQKLFKIVNKLLAFSADDPKTQWACQEGIKYFKDHAMGHFTDEERYMKSIQYSGLEIHKRIHDDFRKKILPSLENELIQQDYSAESVSHFLGVSIGWLIGHTLTEDHAMTGKAISKWGNLLPEDEHAVMKEAILQLLYDLFRLDARVISESYGGEKFGKGIYYRLIYTDGQGKKWETLLIFEEKLLINTVGKMIGIKTDQVNVMLINAVRYTARQFVEGIKKRFPSMELYKMKAENLLTYSQFQKEFEKENPQFSMLFDTGVGYFAYCSIAPNLIESKIGDSINAENAMYEIGEYLKKNEIKKKEASGKKKILVVDDSDLMLQRMKELLGKDYGVALVKSGMAAIRSLTLNRPDLILLDYEMPICDGRQVLEMIRSEEEFADIAVIFLTGKVDRESVRKVMSLNPAGYLSKLLKPEEIKGKIDEYFAKNNS